MTSGNPPMVGTGAHLSADGLRVWTALLDASRIIDTELEADLIANHGMTHREYEILVRLDGFGGSLRMSDLARQIEASAQLVSQTVSRLEAKGWLTREPDDADARGVRAVLETTGREALAAAARPHAAIVERLLVDRLSDELPAVAAALTVVADHLRAHRRGTSCDDPSCPMDSAEPRR